MTKRGTSLSFAFEFKNSISYADFLRSRTRTALHNIRDEFYLLTMVIVELYQPILTNCFLLEVQGHQLTRLSRTLFKKHISLCLLRESYKKIKTNTCDRVFSPSILTKGLQTSC